jgi:hypothetical protein
METRNKILPQTKERTASDTLIRLAHLLARQAARQLMDKGATSQYGNPTYPAPEATSDTEPDGA